MSGLAEAAVQDVQRLRARLDRAQANGQCELHVGLSDMELLVSLSEALLKLYNKEPASE